MKNYTSNYDYLHSCSLDDMSEALNMLLVSLWESIYNKPMPQEQVEVNCIAMKEWLKDVVALESELLN